MGFTSPVIEYLLAVVISVLPAITGGLAFQPMVTLSLQAVLCFPFPVAGDFFLGSD